MDEPVFSDSALARQMAEAMSQRLKEALANPWSRSITLTRDEVILTLGLVDVVAELLDRELRPRAGNRKV